MVASKARLALVVLAALRLVLGIVAIPLAPFLYREHFALLVLLRPTKEVFLAGGFLARRGDVPLPLVVLAAIPLSIFGVWLFFALGRAYAADIRKGSLPPLVARVVDPDKVKRFEKILEARGPRLIFLARLAVMSSAAVAAAAGAAGMETRRFLPWDLAGGLLSIAYTVGAGYALGEAYERAGPWITGVGFIALFGFAWVLGRALKSDD